MRLFWFSTLGYGADLGRSRLVIFRPTIYCVGEENHNLCCVFPKFCQISTFYSILYLILRFTEEEAGVRKQALLFVPARYIRTFDVISEVNCVLLRRKLMFETITFEAQVIHFIEFFQISSFTCLVNLGMFHWRMRQREQKGRYPQLLLLRVLDPP